MSDPLFSDDDIRKFFTAPTDPAAAAQSSLANLHYSLYQNYVSAGFDEDQAFELLLVVIRGLLGVLK
jgi:hypothetical protein